MKIRSSGILLPLFSLPSRFGIGDMGPATDEFIDFLVETGQRVWQILPLNPTAAPHGHSPYHSASAFALNPLLISPERMAEDGLLEAKEIEGGPGFTEDRVVYRQVVEYKTNLLQSAYRNFQSGGNNPDFEAFCADNRFWLEDFALFSALKNRFPDGTWNEWPDGIRRRDRNSLDAMARDLAGNINGIRFLQYTAFRQWQNLKRRCNEKRIAIFGDMPIYVPYDSVDVWAHTDLFKLDPENNPTGVSGVPPDYFSETGQRWGHPLYDWSTHENTGFQWWLDRVGYNLSLFDMLRIDHFRGLVAYWEIPIGEETAVNGKWVEAPVREFFDNLLRRFINPSIVAEDLGLITPDVREILSGYGFPGMRVLLFGFSENTAVNPNVFHNIPTHATAYTGTHDTNTARGWFENELTEEQKKIVFGYLGREVSEDEISWELIRLAFMSRANLAVIPMQDLLNLGAEARLNHPAGVADSNWRWRLTEAQLRSFPRDRLLAITKAFGRI